MAPRREVRTLSTGIAPDCAKLNSRYVGETLEYRPVRRDRAILAGSRAGPSGVLRLAVLLNLILGSTCLFQIDVRRGGQPGAHCKEQRDSLPPVQHDPLYLSL
jgi:hypothetical protein